VVIGRPETATFLVVPRPAADVLAWLAAGRSLEEVRHLHRVRHGQDADLDDFVEVLRRHGFVDTGGGTAAAAAEPPLFRGHLQGFPPAVAKALFSRTALTLYASVILTAAVLAVARPSLIPGWKALYFPHRFLLMVAILVPLHYLGLVVHEFGHFMAARAVGLQARFGIGHRLWYLVAETDLSGLWSIPRRRRYLPLLAGMLLDALTASALLVGLFASEVGWLTPAPLLLTIARALVLRYLLTIAWQFYFFVRTDLYYVLTTSLRCTNLMQDTEDYLRRVISSRLRWVRAPEHELSPRVLKIARSYAVLWILGRLAAVGVLVLVQIPILWHYGKLLVGAVLFSKGTVAPARLFLAALALTSFGIGLGLWLRSLFSSGKLRS